MTMNNEFCPRDCEYLNMTEEQQDMSKATKPHVCLKYNTRLYHLTAHPDLYKCEECYKENSNETVAID